MKKNKKNNNMYNVRYYDMNEMTPDEVMEDYFASEEEAEYRELLDEEFVDLGTYDPNNPEEVDAMMNAIMDAFERENGRIDIDEKEKMVTFPLSVECGDKYDKIFLKEVKKAGDFEMYFGFPASRKAYADIHLNRPYFYCIRLGGSYIGYIGFSVNEKENSMEPEIYIFQDYRNKGYGTKVLLKMAEIVFRDGLPNFKDVEDETIICPSKLVSTVRVENIPSKKLMEKCGFNIDPEVESDVLFITDLKKEEIVNAFEVHRYTLTKEDFLKKASGL